MPLDADEPEVITSEQDYYWFVAKQDGNFLPAIIMPSKTENVDLSIKQSLSYAEPIVLPKERDVAEAGTALHAVLATLILQQKANPAIVQSVSVALLGASGLDSLNVDEVLSAGNAFKSWVAKQWPNAKLYVEYPISMINEQGQRLSGSIDLLVELPQGWIVIDHKSTSTGINQLPHVAVQYGGQLAAYKLALEAVTDKPVLGQWIHFMAMGVVIECGL